MWQSSEAAHTDRNEVVRGYWRIESHSICGYSSAFSTNLLPVDTIENVISLSTFNWGSGCLTEDTYWTLHPFFIYKGKNILQYSALVSGTDVMGTVLGIRPGIQGRGTTKNNCMNALLFSSHSRTELTLWLDSWPLFCDLYHNQTSRGLVYWHHRHKIKVQHGLIRETPWTSLLVWFRNMISS